MKRKRVLFLSKSLADDNQMLLRWKSYYNDRGIKFFSSHIHWGLFSVKNKSKMWLVIRWMSFIRIRKIDFVHANDLESGLLAFHLKSKFEIQYIYAAHEIFSHELPEDNESKFVRKVKLHAQRKTINDANIVVVPNAQRIDFFCKIHPTINVSKYFLIENKSLTQGARQVDVSFLAGMPSVKKAFYGGAFWYARRQETFPLIADALHEAGMALVLSGWSNEYLQKVLSEGEHIHYAGNIPPEQFDDFTAHVDICLAWYYPTTINDELCAPLKIFDYLHAKKFVVAPSLPYIVELAERYPEQIYLFKAGDWRECVEQIILLKNQKKSVNGDLLSCTWESQYAKIDEVISYIDFNK